ncbi:MAG: hypothetical protein GY940_11330, partial [bacterium]|nr:hypothetical protein [bacterium]
FLLFLKIPPPESYLAVNKVSQLDEGIKGVRFSPDGGKIVGWFNNARVELWDVKRSEKLPFIEVAVPVTIAAFSPDGQSIFIGFDEGGAVLFDLDGKSEGSLFVPEGSVTSVAISPDGQYILAGFADQALIWYRQRILKVFKAHWGKVTSVAFSPDGKTILTGSLDKTIRLWDV